MNRCETRVPRCVVSTGVAGSMVTLVSLRAARASIVDRASVSDPSLALVLSEAASRGAIRRHTESTHSKPLAQSLRCEHRCSLAVGSLHATNAIVAESSTGALRMRAIFVARARTALFGESPTVKPPSVKQTVLSDARDQLASRARITSSSRW